MQLDNSKVSRRAADFLANQGLVPRSPGAFIKGEPVLCAGAAFVHTAALMSDEFHYDEELASKMILNGHEYILTVAKELRLDVEHVKQMFTTNDCCPDDLRQETMVRRLRSA